MTGENGLCSVTLKYKYGHILVVIMVYLQKGVSEFRHYITIFCVFILYANNVYCSRPKCY